MFNFDGGARFGKIFTYQIPPWLCFEICLLIKSVENIKFIKAAPNAIKCLGMRVCQEKVNSAHRVE